MTSAGADRSKQRIILAKNDPAPIEGDYAVASFLRTSEHIGGSSVVRSVLRMKRLTKERLTTDRDRLLRVVQEHAAGRLGHLSKAEIAFVKKRIAELDTEIAENLKAGYT